MEITNYTTQTEALELKIRDLLEDEVYTCLPAVVTNVADLNTEQTISARVLLNRVYPDKDILRGAEVHKVPLMFQSAGGGLLSFPIKEGDTVLLLFSKRSIDEWLVGDGSETSSEIGGQFDVSDAIAIPGLYTTKSHLKPNPTDVELKFAGSSIKMKPNGDIDAFAAKDANLSAAGNINLNSAADININAVGNVTITGATVNLN